MATTINPSDQTITQYNVQTGAASNLLNNVAPSATSGVPLISQGSSSQPIFGTTVVAGGGTGDTSFTAYSVITGGTTSTGALQQVSGVGTNGQVLTSAGAGALPTWSAAPVTTVGTITGNDGTALSQSSNNWNIEGYGAAVTGYSPYTTGSGSTMRVQHPGTVKWVVNATANLGTHTTIQSAITSASSGDDVFITPGTYTEDLTLKAGVNLVAYGSDSSFSTLSQVTIIGKATFTGAGTVCIYGVQLQTNSDYFLVVSGSAASVVNGNNCFLNCANHTGISETTSGVGHQTTFSYCTADFGTTGIGLYTKTNAGGLFFNYCNFGNSGGTSTTSTNSAGVVGFTFCQIAMNLASSGSGYITAYNCQLAPAVANTTAYALTGTGISSIVLCYFNTGSAACMTVGSGATLDVELCNLASSNTTAITGAGTLNYALVTPGTAGNQISSVTTSQGSPVGGSTIGSAVGAGNIGESMYSAIALGSAVTVAVSNTFVNITSLTLTPGVWDLCGVGMCTTATGSIAKWSIATTNTGGATQGDSATSSAFPSSGNFGGTIAGYRVTISTNTIYYFNGTAVFTVGSPAVFGRFSATRVG